jgi:hypothetical protein
MKKKKFLQLNYNRCMIFFPGLNYSLNGVFRIEWIFMIPVHDLQA